MEGFKVGYITFWSLKRVPTGGIDMAWNRYPYKLISHFNKAYRESHQLTITLF